MIEPIRTKDASPWQPRESARPLLAWSAQQLEALAATLARTLAAWRVAWGLPADAASVRCAAATSEAVMQEGWQPLGAAGTAWLRTPLDGPQQLAALLFDVEGAAGPIAMDAAQACARDACQRLAGLLPVGAGAASGTKPPTGLGQPWSGGVHAELPAAPGWSLLLAPDAMDTWCRSAGLHVQPAKVRSAVEPLDTTADALGTRSLCLTVELSGCELDLGTLQSLRIGDVVQLRHDLQAPARLTDGDGQALFNGFLVARQGRKAIELVKRLDL